MNVEKPVGSESKDEGKLYTSVSVFILVRVTADPELIPEKLRH